MSRDHTFPPGVPQRVGRMHHNPDGTRKRKWTREQAITKAERRGKNAYCCPVCGWWHVGSTPAGSGRVDL